MSEFDNFYIAHSSVLITDDYNNIRWTRSTTYPSCLREDAVLLETIDVDMSKLPSDIQDY